jgi:hypothetical protein
MKCFKTVLFVAIAFVFVCIPAFAANYTDWTQPFDADANTRLLLHFNDGLTANTANDSSANGVNGTLNAGLAGQADHYVASSQAGFGNALKIVYDGAAKKIDLPTSPALASYTEDLTIECWIKPYEANSYWTILQNYTGGNYCWNFTYVAGKMRMGFGWYGAGDWQDVMDTVTDWDTGPNAAWQHAAVTWEKHSDTGGTDTVRFWKNGVKVFEADTTLKGISNPIDGPAGVGGRWLDGHPWYNFLGQMDELRMSDTIRYGAAPTVPEPASLSVLAMGLCAVVGSTLRRRAR